MIKYLLKFTSKRKYAEAFLSGKMFMRPVSYYHDLALGQGDLREASIFDGFGIYKHANIPVFCMYAVEDCDIENGIVKISERCIKDFKCEEGFAVLLDFKKFEPMLRRVQTYGYQLVAGLVNYHQLTLEDSFSLLMDESLKNVFVKRPYYGYQNEYRIAVAKQVYKLGEKVVDHVEYSFSSNLESAGKIISIAQLDKVGDNYILNVK